jgi:hypothetical protein
MQCHEQTMQKINARRSFEKRGEWRGKIDRTFTVDPELQCGAGDVVLASKLPLRDLRCRLFESRYESGDITPIPVRVFLFRESVRTIADIHGSAPDLIFLGFPPRSDCAEPCSFASSKYCTADPVNPTIGQIRDQGLSGDAFGAPHYVRLSFAASMDTLTKGFDAIEKFLKA